MSNKRKRKRIIIIIMGVILILFSIFSFLSLIGFDPSDSLFFTKKLNINVKNILGKPGSKLSSFYYYFIGRSSFFLSFFLMYSGFILLKRVNNKKRIGLILLSFSTIVTSLVFFSLNNTDIPYKGGGIFGRFITNLLLSYLSRWILITIFSISLISSLCFLFKNILVLIYKLILKLFSKINTKKIKNKLENTNISTIKDENASVSTKTSAQKSYIKKPPLIRKFYYNEEEGLVNSNLKSYNNRNDSRKDREILNYQELDSKAVLENEKGQYLILDTVEDNFHKLEKDKQYQKIVTPNISFLQKSRPINKKERQRETSKKAMELEKTLLDFGIEAKVIGIIRGPVITRYELQPAPGVKLSRIVNLSDNIALNLSANGVRIEAPIPGRSAVGIEIPNNEREIVTLGDIIENTNKIGELPLILGKDIAGNVVVSDLVTMPHLLIAGATGSGKSVCINSLITSLLFKKSPEDVRFVMIDPKMVELKIYNGIPHLLTEVVTNPRNATKALRWIIYEMENRYKLLDEQYVRDIKGYNKRVKEKIPYIIVIVDEFANLMAISQREVEDAVIRLASMSRAVGIHLIMATQRPSVDVITGLIKANFPYRIAFQVASRVDSRTILDTMGAEKLLGQGDMLFSPAGSINIQRIQGAYISEDEVLKIVKELKKNGKPQYIEDIISFEKGKESDISDNDPIFDEAVEIVLQTKRASASFLQRRLKIGYNRAARLIELMEEKGIIGPPRGSKPREIYIDRID